MTRVCVNIHILPIISLQFLHLIKLGFESEISRGRKKLVKEFGMLMSRGISKITQRNWWIDAVLFSSALIAAISGLYFLYFPSGGYQGGRNPYYNMQVLFSRHTWGDLHMWGGIVMIAVAMLHLILHWSWVVNMTRRILKDLAGKNGKMNQRSRLNLLLNAVVGLSFLFTAISGVYFLFVPSGRATVDPMFLFSRITWDLIHTWAGVTLITAGVIHFAIHWRWVINVAMGILKRPTSDEMSTPGQRVLTGKV
jgi:hypothetical protein